jgi:hypothetical protein
MGTERCRRQAPFWPIGPVFGRIAYDRSSSAGIRRSSGRLADTPDEIPHLAGQLVCPLRQIGCAQHMPRAGADFARRLGHAGDALRYVARRLGCLLHFRAISELAAPCCSTAEAFVVAIALPCSIVVATLRMASTASLVAVWVCASCASGDAMISPLSACLFCQFVWSRCKNRQGVCTTPSVATKPTSNRITRKAKPTRNLMR